MAIVSSTNTTPTDSSTAIYALKETLKLANWTVSKSGSSSATPTFSDSTDVIDSAAKMASNSAWFYIEAPNGQGFMFQNQNNSTAWRIKWRGNGGAVGTAVSATITPAITNEIIMRGSGTDAAPGYTNFLPTNSSYRWNVIADDASPYGFWCGAFTLGAGAAYGGMMFDPLTAVSPGDVSPYVVLTANGADTWARGNPASIINWSDESGNSSTTSMYAAYYVASTGSGNAAKATAWFPYNGNWLAYGQVVNPITGNDDLFPLLWARRGAATGGNPGWKGVSTFSKFKGVSRANGDTYTVSTTRDRISFGDYSLPWDGSVPVL